MSYDLLRPAAPSAHGISQDAMRCPTCGESLEPGQLRCPTCGAQTRSVAPPAPSLKQRLQPGLLQCPRCGNYGTGSPYFSRVSNVGLLVGVSLFPKAEKPQFLVNIETPDGIEVLPWAQRASGLSL